MEPEGWRYAFLVLSLALLAVWLILYAARSDLHRSMLRVSLGVVIAGGRTGTLGEPAIAYDEGRLLGILIGTRASRGWWKGSDHRPHG